MSEAQRMFTPIAGDPGSPPDVVTEQLTCRRCNTTFEYEYDRSLAERTGLGKTMPNVCDVCDRRIVATESTRRGVESP